MIRSWSQGDEVLDVLSERETIYRLLAQTTHENLNKDHTNYTVDPQTRYPNLVLGTVKPFQVKSLYDTDDTQTLTEKYPEKHKPAIVQNQNKDPKLKRNASLIAPKSYGESEI